MQAPFPHPASKYDIAKAVWSRFGDPDSYFEPCAGSAAILFARPNIVGREVINDINGFYTNFYRAAQRDPAAVVAHADWPANEWDFKARYDWLVTQGKDRLAPLLLGDPDWFDVRIAGWWFWGIPLSGNSEWCAGSGSCPDLAGRLGSPAGVAASLQTVIGEVSRRLRDVTIACGDWKRVVAQRCLTKGTAVFLDPPPDGAAACRTWAIKHGHRLKIALCGLAGEERMPKDWEEVSWQPEGVGNASEIKHLVWFSPRCTLTQHTLF